MERSCINCKFALSYDTGYSNWTVTGCEFSCALNAHPDGTFDEFYQENPKLKYAQQCEHYVEGEPVNFDVDGEAEHTPEQKEIISIAKLSNALHGIE